MLKRVVQSQWLRVPPEVVARYRTRSIPLLVGALRARLRHEISLAEYFGRRMQEWSADRVVDFMHFSTMTDIQLSVNPRSNWRLSDDKVANTERYLLRGVPAAPILFVIGRDRANNPEGAMFAMA